MIVAIHQPNYAPWLGYFHKILSSDVFVFLDNVQFTKGGFQNRVKIKTPNGENWITQNIKKSQRSAQLTNEVEFDHNRKWISKHLKTLDANYRKSPHFNELFPILEYYYKENEDKSLAQFNIGLIELFCTFIGISGVKFEIASELNVNGHSTELLVDICKNFGATEYLSGKGGDNYQSETLFLENRIVLTRSKFAHPQYNQCWKGFNAGLSILDLCFNEGSKSLDILRSASEVREK